MGLQPGCSHLFPARRALVYDYIIDRNEISGVAMRSWLGEGVRAQRWLSGNARVGRIWFWRRCYYRYCDDAVTFADTDG